MEGSRGEWMGVEESGGEERGGDDRRVEGSKGEWKGVEEGGKATHETCSYCKQCRPPCGRF